MSNHEIISLSSDSEPDAGPVAGPSQPRPSTTARKRRAPPRPPSASPARNGSAELDVPHALDDASRTQLHVAIATASEARVREAFAALVDSVPAVTERVFSMLVAASEEVEMEVDAAPVARDPVPRSPVKAGKVRAKPVMPGVPRWEVCANCKERYDAGAERRGVECRYHPGALKVNYNAFEDWDEDVHGEMDTPDNRRDFPENFTWTCCRRNGTKAGCVHGEHGSEFGDGPSQGKRKKARLR
ncbi:hypothetical protein C2E23DRAFT_881862 [Lenzites betulinus]|nr:hypothetical protein C2E23DRAFT_881862 [Lenzites betulinus]